MTRWINIGGQDRPLEFSYAVAYDYESDTGGNYNELVFKVAKEAEAVSLAVASGDLMAIASAMSVKPIADLAYFGLLYAHRNHGITVDFTPRDVAGWLFGDRAAMQAVMITLFESLPKPGEDEGAKKKPTAAKGSRIESTGKTLSRQPQPSE